MGENTKIEWAHHSFNPWYGCQKVGPGCDHCYAERWAKRSGLVQWGAGAARRRSSPANWRKPLVWNAAAERLGTRYRVFCASLADVFDNAVPDGWRMDLFELISRTPHLDWLIVTKRVGNVVPMCSHSVLMLDALTDRVWLGATVCNQDEADRDIPKLLSIPARVRFLSMEPLLGLVRLNRFLGAKLPAPYPFLVSADSPAPRGVDWVVVGGESGPKARPMHPDWACSLRDQCAAAEVPFLFKQWGEWAPMMGRVEGVAVAARKFTQPDGTIMGRAVNKTSYRLLDGALHDGYPQCVSAPEQQKDEVAA